MVVRIVHGDCREVLPTLPVDSFDCIVTSPPYWGLRDYGTATWEGGNPECDHAITRRNHGSEKQSTSAGTSRDKIVGKDCQRCGARRIDTQIGLEPTLDAYVETMVAVGRALWRVLKPEGTFWLNLGSSYFGGGRGGGGSFAKERASYRVGADGKRPIPFPEPPHVRAYGSDGKEPSGSTGLDSACSDPDGERQGGFSIRRYRTIDTGALRPQSSWRDERIGQHSEPLDSELRAELSRLSPKALSFLGYAPDDFCHGATASAYQQQPPRYSADEHLRTGHVSGRIGRDTAFRTSGKDASATAFDSPSEAFRRYLAIQSQHFKAKDLVDVPHLVALALQADGWWLRSAIVWAKPNPMPESVTDRPTSAYEMVFLLTKAERYFYDADAIREGISPTTLARYGGPPRRTGLNGQSTPERSVPSGAAQSCGINENGRNARNVWTISTQPYSGAHFATMPPDLAERCIKAGCPVGGRVLDPFGGAGTTGLIADRLGRNATLIELNPTYRELAADRTRDDAPLFAQVTA